MKQDVNGNIAGFKARWVVKNNLQQFGIDFDQIFVVIIQPIAFRVLFAIAAFFDLDINQINIKTVFLYKLIKQLVYIDISKGSEIETN